MILRPSSISLSPTLPHIFHPALRLGTSSICFHPSIHGHRPFSHSPHLQQSPGNTPTNHYEILKLPMHATKADLKRQFYVLSKETHPDVNRQDPRASDRFAQISESYSILADPGEEKEI